MSEFTDVNWSVVHNVWIKQMVFKEKGDRARTHVHAYDHQTLLAVGRLRVTVGEYVKEFTAPAIVVILKGMPHTLEALESNTVAYCIHAVHDEEPVVVGTPNDQLHSLA